MKDNLKWGLLTLALIWVPGFSTASTLQRLERITEEQLETLGKQIREDTRHFRKSLDDALDDSRLEDRKSAKDIKRFVDEFESATDRLEDRLDDRDSGTGPAQEVLRRAAVIDSFMLRNRLSPRLHEDWMALRAKLDELARAYNVSWSWTGSLRDPERLSQKEMEQLLKRIEKGTDRFRGSLKTAVDRSRIDDSRAEDRIEDSVDRFEEATDRLEDRFDEKDAAVGAASEVLKRAAVIDDFMRRHALTPRAQDDWLSLRRELDELARAYGVSVFWNSSN